MNTGIKNYLAAKTPSQLRNEADMVARIDRRMKEQHETFRVACYYAGLTHGFTAEKACKVYNAAKGTDLGRAWAY